MGVAASGRPTDLLVSALSTYTPRSPSANGLSGRFGSINLDAGSSVILQFAFVDSENNEPAVVEQAYLSIFDIDHNTDGSGTETLW